MIRPRIAIVVANSITGDSRVIKSAVTAERLGFDVLLVGTSTTGFRTESNLGDIRVVRVVNAPSGAGAGSTGRRVDGVWEIRPMAPLAFRSADSYTRAAQRRTDRRARTRLAIERRKGIVRSTEASRFGRLRARVELDVLRVRSVMLDGWFVIRRRAYVRPPWRLGRATEVDPLTALLRDQLPVVKGYVDAMTPELDAFAPDLVHAHDMYMSAVGASYARWSEGRGRRVPWVYDAHEWVSGLREERAVPKTIAAERLEQLVIHEADAVVTVGEAIAAELHAAYSLEVPPVVVMNAPPCRRNLERGGELRAALGVAVDIPLLVYHGVVKPKRGVSTVVEALVELPDVHLALVADPVAPHVIELQDRAEHLGVRDRLHVHPYVAPDQISGFVADATAGIHPLTHSPNAEVAIPTKLLEYVQARLPVIVSDTTEMSAFVRRHGIGEVFVSEDPQSFAKAATTLIGMRSTYLDGYDELAETYTWEAQEPLLAAVYASVLGGDPPVPAVTDFVVPDEIAVVT